MNKQQLKAAINQLHSLWESEVTGTPIHWEKTDERKEIDAGYTDQLMQLIDQYAYEYAERVIEWLEGDLKRLNERNWSMEALALFSLVSEDRATAEQKERYQQIVEDRRAAHALYAILNNYKAQLSPHRATKEGGDDE